MKSQYCDIVTLFSDFYSSSHRYLLLTL